MRIERKWFLAIAVVLTSLWLAVNARTGADETRIRWDLVNIDFTTGTLLAGGSASARANDGSKITLTGSGTFKPDDTEEVTGGGNWTTFDSTGAMTGSGTYEVKRLVKFDVAPGTFPLKIETSVTRSISGEASCFFASATPRVASRGFWWSAALSVEHHPRRSSRGSRHRRASWTTGTARCPPLP